MFSYIEGSTEKTDRLGDKAWMEVLRDHNAILREQLKAFGGFEVKSEGDGFMVAFQSAGKALGCAAAIQKARRWLRCLAFFDVLDLQGHTEPPWTRIVTNHRP